MKFNSAFAIPFLLFLFVLSNETSAQPQLWELYTVSNQPYVNIVIDKYESDLLYINYMEQTRVIHQDSVQFLIKRNESKAGIGVFAGIIFGGLFGYLVGGGGEPGIISGFGHTATTLLGGLIGGALGGAAGSAAGADDKYELSNMDIEHRRELLNKLFTQ